MACAGHTTVPKGWENPLALSEALILPGFSVLSAASSWNWAYATILLKKSLLLTKGLQQPLWQSWGTCLHAAVEPQGCYSDATHPATHLERFRHSALKRGVGVTVPGGIQEPQRCSMEGHGLAGVDWWLDDWT